MNVNETIYKIKHDNDLTHEELMAIKKEVMAFLKGDAPKEEKELFYPFGYLEMLCMRIGDFGG